MKQTVTEATEDETAVVASGAGEIAVAEVIAEEGGEVVAEDAGEAVEEEEEEEEEPKPEIKLGTAPPDYRFPHTNQVLMMFEISCTYTHCFLSNKLRGVMFNKLDLLTKLQY